jgi:glycerol-3-phosphate acyltransferase PlsY
MRSVLVVIVAYLIGSIPVGYLIVRATSGGDIRETGSGGTGATNVSRRSGKRAGIVTLLLDVMKGVVAAFVARIVVNPNWVIADWLIAASAVAAIVGHIFPVWLRFRGGKGVAIGAGIFFALQPLAVLCAGIVFVIIFRLTRYVSLSSIIGALVIPLAVWLTHNVWPKDLDLVPMLIGATICALLIIFAHRGNIARLVKGTEPKFS